MPNCQNKVNWENGMAKKTFSRQICILRQDYGLTQPEFARDMDVSARTVSGWENGDRVPKNPDRLLAEAHRILKKKYGDKSEETSGTGEPESANPSATKGMTEEMYRQKYEEAQEEIIGLLKKNAELEKRISELGVSEKKDRMSRKANGK